MIALNCEACTVVFLFCNCEWYSLLCPMNTSIQTTTITEKRTFYYRVFFHNLVSANHIILLQVAECERSYRFTSFPFLADIACFFFFFFLKSLWREGSDTRLLSQCEIHENILFFSFIAESSVENWLNWALWFSC